MALIGQLVTRRVAQHMRMDGELLTGMHAGPRHDLADSRVTQRTTTFAEEHIGRDRRLALESAQRSNFGTTQRMNRRYSAFESLDVNTTVTQVDEVPLQRNQFRDAQCVPVADQDQRGIAVAVPCCPSR